MKSDSALSLAIVAGFALLGGSVYLTGKAMQPPSSRMITISDSAEIEAMPDRTTLSISIITTDEADTKKAKDKNDELTAKFIDVVNEFKIPKENVKTMNINTGPQYDYIEGRQTLRAFIASRDISLNIDDITSYEKVISQLTQIGISQINNINFTLKDKEEIEGKARAKAIEKTRKKAEEITAALGVKIRRIAAFNEGGNPRMDYYAPNMMVKSGAPMRAATEAVQNNPMPGAITVDQSVSVTYEFE